MDGIEEVGSVRTGGERSVFVEAEAVDADEAEEEGGGGLDASRVGELSGEGTVEGDVLSGRVEERRNGKAVW